MKLFSIRGSASASRSGISHESIRIASPEHDFVLLVFSDADHMFHEVGRKQYLFG